MTRPALLTDAEISQWLQTHPLWTRDGSGLTRSLVFADFNEAFAFMTRVAVVAEQIDHHPNWANVYNQVHITITTHDVGGITRLDLQLAEAVDEIGGV